MQKKKRIIKNIEASARARLLNLAKQTNRDFNAVLLQYFQERFLYRLSLSSYRDQLILKGALLFIIDHASPFRPTKDIDFLGILNTKHLKKVICDISRISSNDGVQFNVENISIEAITPESEYNGFRVKLYAFLGDIRKLLQLDIGIGDVIFPGPIEIDFPTLLENPPPRIKIYSKESVIAEKFEAIVRFNFLTSRMKDFYDILFLAQHNIFQLSIINNAIIATFNNRNTLLEDGSIIFNTEFKNLKDKQELWTAFLKRNHLKSFELFSEMISYLGKFIKPIFSIKKNRAKEYFWQPKRWEWSVSG